MATLTLLLPKLAQALRGPAARLLDSARCPGLVRRSFVRVYSASEFIPDGPPGHRAREQSGFARLRKGAPAELAVSIFRDTRGSILQRRG